MKKYTITPIIAAAMTIALSSCDIEKTQEGELPDVDVKAEAGQMPEYEVEQTQEGKMPDVDVDVEGGQMPKYDVETPDVDVGTKEKEISVPDVDVDMEKKKVTVPDVDVDMPDDNEK